METEKSQTFILPNAPVEALRDTPALAILFGQSKVGKTGELIALKDCLIIDTEKGTDTRKALKVNVNSLSELKEVMVALKQRKKKYTYIAFDTIDKIVMWLEAAVAKTNGVKDIGDIPYGGGYSQVRTSILTMIEKMKELSEHIILVAHRKKTIIGEDSILFDASSLDMTGRLKNMLCADADLIGYMYRDSKDDNKLSLSFTTNNEIDAGTRNPDLAGKTFPFDWKLIYPKAEINNFSK